MHRTEACQSAVQYRDVLLGVSEHSLPTGQTEALNQRAASQTEWTLSTVQASASSDQAGPLRALNQHTHVQVL